MNLSIGNKAPLFTLYSDEQKMIALEDLLKEPLILLFFPQAFNSLCTQELHKIQDLSTNRLKLANIAAVSVDSTFTLKEFKRINHYYFPLISDFNKEVSRAYGCLYEYWLMNMRGVSKRAAFIIDETRTIKYAEVLENANNQLNYSIILSTLDKLS